MNESAVDAALREAREELGVAIGDIEVLSVCQTIPAITGTLVTPILAYLNRDVGDFEHFSPNTDEVKRVFTRSVSELTSPNYVNFKTYTRNGKTIDMPLFGKENDEQIWGLTAMILHPILYNIVLPVEPK